ncbi:MAG: kynureninase, partial [Paracoccaceae bacterium]
LGHEEPFDFDLGYRPHAGIERMRVGTPPVIALNLLEAALDVWDGVDIHQLREKSLELSDLFISEMARRCPDIGLACPANGLERGSQVSFSFTEGYATMQALIARGVIGDFRAPDIIRFGITPLYVGANDILRAVDVLEDVITNRLWDRPEYHVRAEVT